MQLVRMERQVPSRFTDELDKAKGNALQKYMLCTLKNGSILMDCYLLEMANINTDNGIISGFIKINNVRNLANLLSRNMPDFRTSDYKDISNMCHTYAEKYKTQPLQIKIDKYSFAYVELNRYRSCESIFRFIGRIDLDTLNEFLKYMEDKNGTENTKLITRRD